MTTPELSFSKLCTHILTEKDEILFVHNSHTSKTRGLHVYDKHAKVIPWKGHCVPLRKMLYIHGAYHEGSKFGPTNKFGKRFTVPVEGNKEALLVCSNLILELKPWMDHNDCVYTTLDDFNLVKNMETHNYSFVHEKNDKHVKQYAIFPKKL
jgi:hypothetical protein